MKRGIFKRITAFMLALTMVLTMMPSTVIVATAGETDRSKVTKKDERSGIEMEKKASFVTDDNGNIVKDEHGNPKVKIEFKVDTSGLKSETETIVAGDTDIVLVIDRSGSMENDKIQNAKDAAKSFVEDVLKLNSDDVNIQVGLVSFASDVTIDQELTTNTNKLKKAINSLKASGGTFVQAGIKKAAGILEASKAKNKIMILLSDGEPTYRYKLNTTKVTESRREHRDIFCLSYGLLGYCNHDKHYYVKTVTVDKEDESVQTITAPLANPTSYDALYNFSSVKTGDGDSTTDIIKRATISQAYLARKDISGLSIYTVGYEIAGNDVAKSVLTHIADNNKDLLAGVDSLTTVINAIKTQVEKRVEGVNLFDKVPNGISVIKNTVTTNDDVIGEVDSNGNVKYKWKNALVKKEYTMSFEAILDLDSIPMSEFKGGAYFNTNGSEIQVGENVVNSAILSYGTTDDDTIKLNSPQLPLEAVSYKVHYFYDGQEGKSEEGYVLKGITTKNLIIDRDEAGYTLERIVVNETDNNGLTECVVSDKDVVINVYFKKEVAPEVTDNPGQEEINKTINLTIKKQWAGKDLKDSYKPEQVDFKIYRDGILVKDSVHVDAENNWEVTKVNLPTERVDLNQLKDIDVKDLLAQYESYDSLELQKLEQFKEIFNKYDVEDINKLKDLLKYFELDKLKELFDTLNAEDMSDLLNLIKREELIEKINSYKKNVDKIDLDTILKLFANFSDLKDILSEIDKNDLNKIREFIDSNIKVEDINKYKEMLNIPENTSNLISFIKEQIKNNKINIKDDTEEILRKLAELNKINYTVVEVKTDELKAKFDCGEPVKSVDENGNITFTVKNTLKSVPNDTVTVSGTKVWDDGNNRDKMRPSSIDVELYRNNKLYDTKKVYAVESNEWSYEFTGLAKYYRASTGKVEEYDYTVQEGNINSLNALGYRSVVGQDGRTITNTRPIDTKTVKVRFEWDDNDDSFNSRPVGTNGIKAKLVQSGSEKIVYPNGEGIWTDEWTGLPVNDESGNKIEYSVEQVTDLKDRGYETLEPTVDEDGTIVITNKYVPKVSKKITVNWVDEHDENEIRPEKTTVKLYADGNCKEDVDVIPLDYKIDKWEKTLSLPKYDNNWKEIEYTVNESVVNGYKNEHSPDTFIITYTYTPSVVDPNPNNPVGPTGPSNNPVVTPPNTPGQGPTGDTEVTVEPSDDPAQGPADEVEETTEPTEEVTEAPTNAPANEAGDSDNTSIVEETVQPTDQSNRLQAPVTDTRTGATTYSLRDRKGNGNTPKTGDDNNTLLYCLYMLLSATGIVVVYSRKRKNRA